MNVFDHLSSSKGSRTEDANKKLGRRLAKEKDRKSIKQLSEGLYFDDMKIVYDCLSTFEYIAEIDPNLAAPYWIDFLKLTGNIENKLVWASMIVLALIADIEADNLFKKVNNIKSAIKKGSVITVDRGMLVLSKIAAAKPQYNKELFPYLLKVLKTCRPKSVAQYTETVSLATNAQNRNLFVKTVEKRRPELKESWEKRVNKVLRNLE